MNTVPPDPRAQLTVPDSPAQIIADLAAIGYGNSLRPGPADASLVCGACGSVAAVDQFGDTWATRLEGQSDPDDMVLLVAARCPVCGEGGSVVLGFGPMSSDADSAVVAAVPDEVMHRLARPDRRSRRERLPGMTAASEGPGPKRPMRRTAT